MGYLNQAEETQLQEIRRSDNFAEMVLCQFHRILASHTFARVQQKARDFLGFIVSKRLLGHVDQIKETMIAVAVYGEPADFNPAESAKVRVAAGELRRKLADYYSNEGRHDPIEIHIPLDTYVPELFDRRALVDVARFDNWHPHRDQDFLCTSISDEIAYRLNQNTWIRARRNDHVHGTSDWANYRLRGSIEISRERLRLNMSLARLSSCDIIFGRSIEGERDALMSLTKNVVILLLPVLEKDVHICRRTTRISHTAAVGLGQVDPVETEKSMTR
jgi:TolB-like protein